MSDVFRKRFVMPGRRDALESAEQEVLDALTRFGYGPSDAFAVRLALEEALSNAVRHGNRGEPDRMTTLECEINDQHAVFHVHDEGEGFDPASVPDPTAAENLQIPAGRGLMLMRAFMAEVTIHKPGNRVTMRYVRGSGGNT